MSFTFSEADRRIERLRLGRVSGLMMPRAWRDHSCAEKRLRLQISTVDGTGRVAHGNLAGFILRRWQALSTSNSSSSSGTSPKRSRPAQGPSRSGPPPDDHAAIDAVIVEVGNKLRVDQRAPFRRAIGHAGTEQRVALVGLHGLAIG